ncbi:MAG TPA: CehA/McbA family metallohydrolase [Planctomycetota bacterium]|nr:CehA/McbA family metallohydrolase [Planctomycetota bacterium]
MVPAGVCWISALLLSGLDETGSFHLRIVEADSSTLERALPCRVHITGPGGEPVRVPGLPFFRDHVSCEGELRFTGAPGRYSYTVERGPEYRRGSGAIEVAPGKETEATVRLERWIDLAARGWWSGETHVHRPLEEMPILLRAEDLHVAPVLTVWNQRNLWSERAPPPGLLVEPEPGRAFHILSCEDERQGGAILYHNLSAPLDFRGDGPEHPSPMTHVDEALEQPGAWVEIEKPFWWDAPTWAATGKVRSIGIANNHMCRASMYENEAWGRPRDAARLPPPRGNGFHSQEVYYRLLNCGFRIPPSAGSASGVLPNPIGYNRVYVFIEGPFSHEAWWKGLGEGRSFVTNGPVLLVEANGRRPGAVLQAPEGGAVRIALDVRVDGNDPLERIEVIRDGEVVEAIGAASPDGECPRGWIHTRNLLFEKSGWLIVRAVAKVPETFRFASTAPFFVEVGKTPRRIHRKDVEYFLRWIDERIDRLETSEHLKDRGQRDEALRPHREARKTFEGLLKDAE